MIIEEIESKNNDENLYKQFLLGNKQAFNELIVKHRKVLINFIMYYIKDIDIAEDIAQEGFLHMIINREDYDFKYTFKTYLFTIAKCKTLNYIKREKKKIYLNDLNYEYFITETNIEDEIINGFNREEVKKAIKQLKKEYQISIFLFYFQNFKYAEISEILNIGMSKTRMML